MATYKKKSSTKCDSTRQGRNKVGQMFLILTLLDCLSPELNRCFALMVKLFNMTSLFTLDPHALCRRLQLVGNSNDSNHIGLYIVLINALTLVRLRPLSPE